MIRLKTCVLAVALSACSDTTVYYHGSPVPQSVLDNLSDRFDEHCGLPMVFSQEPVPFVYWDRFILDPETREYGDYRRPMFDMVAEAGDQAVTHMMINTNGNEGLGLYFGPSPLYPNITITWMSQDIAALEHIMQHEIGHRFGLAHRSEDPNNNMYPIVDPGNIQYTWDKDQWAAFCRQYLRRTELSIEKRKREYEKL